MSNDYLQKQPTKNEKIIYELSMQQQQLERGLGTVQNLVIALARALTSYEALASFAFDQQKNQVFLQNLDLAFSEEKRKAEEAKKPKRNPKSNEQSNLPGSEPTEASPRRPDTAGGGEPVPAVEAKGEVEGAAGPAESAPERGERV